MKLICRTRKAIRSRDLLLLQVHIRSTCPMSKALRVTYSIRLDICTRTNGILSFFYIGRNRIGLSFCGYEKCMILLSFKISGTKDSQRNILHYESAMLKPQGFTYFLNSVTHPLPCLPSTGASLFHADPALSILKIRNCSHPAWFNPLAQDYTSRLLKGSLTPLTRSLMNTQTANA